MRIPHALLFGEGFYQNAEVVVIQKNSLPRLNPSSQNRAESLLTALILQVVSGFSGHLQNENGEVLTTESNEPLEFDNSPLYNYLTVSLWRIFPDVKRQNPCIVHTFLMQIYASNTIPYEVPITPDDL